MQSTHKIPGGSATTWSRYLLAQASRGDYYTHDGQGGKAAPTSWHGPEELLRSYGIDPAKRVELRDLRSLMHGFSPVDGEAIRPAGSDKTRVAGIDLTFSPPKTVSALWATSGPYRRAQIEVAHREAVKSALGRTEREVALIRRKTDGVVRYEKAKRLLAIESVHTTSRLAKDRDAQGIPDPQLHSHVTVIAAERKDGQMAAVESKQLFRAARENGAWYRAELAENLKRLGLPIERRTGNGERYFEIKGVSKDLAEHWSTRSQDVDRAAKTFRQRYGREPQAGELDSLTLGTRGSKTAATPAEVSAAWQALGAEHNQTQKRSEELFNDWGLNNNPNIDLAKELLTNVTRETSMITTHELHAKAYELSAGVCRPTEADRLIEDLARSGELLKLKDDTWTTRHLREQEQATIDIAQRRANENAAPVSARSLKQARREIAKEIKGSLTQEQREALQKITEQGGVSVLVGRAGTGKGVTLATAARAWQLEGNEVIGTAIAGATAQRLKDDAKLDRSYTTDGLLNAIENDHIRLDAKTVVVMDEAGMADSDRLSRLVQATAEHESKLVLAGDAAQLSPIGAGGLFKELEGRIPTAELTMVHRANHEWERQAWEQIRNGEPGPALVQYRAHDRLHIHDTRVQAAEAMVENWDKTRRSSPNGQAVMITDASNRERDQINAMAQERRAQAGELGTHRVPLPEKPYGLATGDRIIFTAQHQIPGQKRVENGITGTIINTSRNESKVAIQTNERDPRNVQIDTSKFSDLSLAYAVHVHKGQGLTTETSGILTGSWQTDREHTYVAVSRAREQTQIYLAREDLGEQGMDPGAIERLAERMQHTRAQQASITKETADRDNEPFAPETTTAQQTAEHDRSDQRASTGLDPHQSAQRRPRRTQIEDDHPIPRDQPDRSRDKVTENAAPRPAARAHPGTGTAPIDILQANPGYIQITEWDLGDIQIAHTQIYDLQGYTGEQTYALFGAWQTEHEQGFTATTVSPNGPETHSSSEPRGDRDIAAELKDRVKQVIERSHGHAASPAQEPSEQTANREIQQDRPAQLEPVGPDTDRENNTSHDPDRPPEREPVGRDPYIEQAIQDARDRQQAWEQGIDPDRDNDRGYGIE